VPTFTTNSVQLYIEVVGAGEQKLDVPYEFFSDKYPVDISSVGNV
jgi:hypothetical protein